ncbi:MAG: AMP-binding protein [Bacteroidota bacterium]
MLKLDFSLSKEDILKKVSDNDNNWAKDILFFLDEWWNQEVYISAETSGSTGTPKLISLEKSKVINSAKSTGDFFGFNENNTALLCMSPKFIAGKLMIVRAIAWKMNLICIKPDSNPLELVPEDNHIDFAAMVPLQVKNSIDKINSRRVSKLIIGGGSIDSSLLENIKKSDTEIYSTYGMTESITHIALKKLNGVNPGLYYKALNDVSFATDKRNCLVIDSPKVSKTKIITNDIVELIDDKTFDWLGRYDNVINSGGIKINPEKLEAILSKVISVPFFISSVKDETLGEKVILLIEGEKNIISLKTINGLLPRYHTPKDVYYLKEFSRTESGKIQRRRTVEKISIQL